MKSPKKYECLECGFKSNRSRTLNVGFIGFARCFKCKGKVKETEQWLKWYQKEMDKFYANKK